jgi:hypothetical protein
MLTARKIADLCWCASTNRRQKVQSIASGMRLSRNAETYEAKFRNQPRKSSAQSIFPGRPKRYRLRRSGFTGVVLHERPGRYFGKSDVDRRIRWQRRYIPKPPWRPEKNSAYPSGLPTRSTASGMGLRIPACGLVDSPPVLHALVGHGALQGVLSLERGPIFATHGVSRGRHDATVRQYGRKGSRQ